MIKHMTRLTAIGTALAGGVLLTAGVGAPAAASGDFGDHVSTCAQTVGFSADHNPGMHRGRHGWDPTHGC